METRKDMTIEDRDVIFNEFGYVMLPGEHSMGVGIWRQEFDDIFIFAKYMGTWNWFSIVEAQTRKEAVREYNRDYCPAFSIISKDQLRTILTSI